MRRALRDVSLSIIYVGFLKRGGGRKRNTGRKHIVAVERDLM